MQLHSPFVKVLKSSMFLQKSIFLEEDCYEKLDWVFICCFGYGLWM